MTPLRDSLPTVLRWTVRIATASLAVGMLAAPAAAYAAGAEPSAPASPIEPSAAATPINSAPFAYLQNYNSDKCIEVPGYSTQAGIQLDQWSCIDQTNELWRPYLNTSGDYVFWNEANKQCIEVAGYSTANGAWEAQWPCAPASAAANFIYYPYLFIGNMNGQSYYEWANIYTNKCLNVSQGSTANGAKIIQWACIPTAKDEWFALPFAS
jgi:ricin-type beta-trefoil lectin protein